MCWPMPNHWWSGSGIMTVLLRSWSNKPRCWTREWRPWNRYQCLFSVCLMRWECFTHVSCSFSTRTRSRCWTRWRDTGRAPRWSWASSRKTGKYGNCSKKTKVFGEFANKSCHLRAVFNLNPHVSLDRAAHITGGASVCAGAHHEQIQRAGVSPSDGQQERRSCYCHPAQRTAH